MYLHSISRLNTHLLLRYGYVDPQGEIQEFTYESGLPCDPLTKQPLNKPSAAFFNPGVRPSKATTLRSGEPPRSAVTGYFDYSANRFVLPDGRRVKVVVNKDNMARG